MFAFFDKLKRWRTEERVCKFKSRYEAKYKCSMSGFLYIDDSKIVLKNGANGESLYSYNALYVPVKVYPILRKNLQARLNPLLQKKPHTIELLPELHYSNLLKEDSDDLKIQVLEAIVQELVAHDVLIFRVGYFSNKETNSLLKSDGRDIVFYGSCRIGI